MRNELRSRWQDNYRGGPSFHVRTLYVPFFEHESMGAEHGFVWDLDSLFVSVSLSHNLRPRRIGFKMEPFWACSPVAFLGMMLEENDEDSYKT